MNRSTSMNGKNIRDFRIKVSFILLLLLGCCYYSVANKPNVVNFYRVVYDAANKNWAVTQDTFGVMYLGNDKGLLEFDGIRWKLHTLPEAEVVRAVAVNSKNQIFTGGYEEFGLWERDASGELVYTSLSKDLKKGNGLRNDDIWKIIATDQGVYFQSFGHIYTYDYHKVRTVEIEGGPILFLMQVGKDLYIQKIRGMLCRLADGKLVDIPGSEIFSSTEIRTILPYDGNRCLIGTSGMGLYLFDGQHFTPWAIEFSNTIKSYELNNGILLKNGHYVFGTILNGIYEVDKQGAIINHFSTENSLQNNTVLSLFEDRNNNIWAALDRGIGYIQYLRDMDCYTDRSGKVGAVYTAAFFEDKLFLGTNKGVYYLPKSKLESSNALSYLEIIDGTQGQVWDMKIIGGKLMCGHNKGLLVIDKSLKFTLHDVSGVYNVCPVNYMNSETIFLGTYTSAGQFFPDFKRFHRLDNFREPIYRIEPDHLGNIWMEHANKGIYRWHFTEKIDSVRYIESFGGVPNDTLPFHLKLFKLGNRIVFYGNNNFYIYNDIEDRIMKFEELNTFLKDVNDLKVLVQLPAHYSFAIGNECLYKIHYDGHHLQMVDKYNISSYNLSLVNRYENAVALDDSLALICLDDGFLLHKFRQHTAVDMELQAPYIRTVTSNYSGKKKKNLILQSGKTVYIPYSENNVTFDFFAKDVFSKNLHFQYQLSRVGNEWSSPLKINEVTFERLPEGDYTFMLRTVDNLGNASPPTSLHFRILPPWYANSLAYFVYFILFMITMAGIWFMVLRRYRNAHLLKVRMREERRLKKQNRNLQQEIEAKNEELFTQTSFIIQKNDLIVKVKHEIDEFYNSYSGNKILRPLYLKIESLLNKNLDMEEDWKMFLIQFERKHTGFFKKMKEIQPDLTSHELKLCACLKLNLSSKDIASLMNISLRGVENSRYRLRKKLNLSPNQNLNDYFLNL